MNFKKRKVKEICYTHEFDSIENMTTWLKKNIIYYEDAMELSLEAIRNNSLTDANIFIINTQKIQYEKVESEFLKEYEGFEFLEKYRLK